MAKWTGNVGFETSIETAPGVTVERITTRKYFGDMTRNTRHLQQSDGLNDNVNIANELSIVADPFVNENFHAIRYVEYMGTKWKVNGVEVQYPRLILSLGGIYNG